MWQYSQSTGILLDPSGYEVGVGYSGNGDAMNDPASQGVAMHGPLPQGVYDIGPAHVDARLGPVAMRLTPREGTEMFGRAGFFIHGDNAALDHSGSDGCIVLAHEVRMRIADSADCRLWVVRAHASVKRAGLHGPR